MQPTLDPTTSSTLIDDAIEMIGWEPCYAQDFAALNKAWIQTYFTIEAEDSRVLDNPQTEILDKGGVIIFARHRESGDIAGTCALLKETETRYELAKMAVSPQFQGQQIGKKLGLSAIAQAKALGADTLVLETNSQLTPAISLYKKLGFEQIPFESGRSEHFDRADVRMTL